MVIAAEAVAELVRALLMFLIPYKVDLAVLAAVAVAVEWISLVSPPHQVVILLVEAAVQVVVLPGDVLLKMVREREPFAINLFFMIAHRMEETQRASQEGKSDPSQNGGIDIQQIKVDRTGDGAAVRLDPAMLQKMVDTGFDGLTPVFLGMRSVDSPLAAMGVK